MRVSLRHRYTRLTLGLLLASMLALAGCSRLSLPQLSGVIQPSIKPSGETRYERVERAFTFEDRSLKLTVPVDRSVYAGAVSAEKRAIRFGTAEQTDWVGDYYRAFISEKHQETFYTALQTALAQVREQDGLDGDRYIELVVAMVQQMEYRTDPVNLSPKFPIETFGDGDGDCDDKALLAAGVLAREGYDVAILVFSPEKHVALGIKAPGLDYAGTGYAFVEATGPMLIGSPPERLYGGVKLTSRPKVVRVGDGTRTYGAGDQVSYIQRRLREVRAREQELGRMISLETAALAQQREALAAGKSEVSRAIQGDPAAAKVVVDRYNAQVRDYNDRVARHNGVVQRHNSLIELQRFAAKHQNDRPALYRKLLDAQL